MSTASNTELLATLTAARDDYAQKYCEGGTVQANSAVADIALRLQPNAFDGTAVTLEKLSSKPGLAARVLETMAKGPMLLARILYSAGCEVFALDETMRALGQFGVHLGIFTYGNVPVQILPGKLGVEIGALNADAFAARCGQRIVFGKKTADGDSKQTACPQKLINAIVNNAAHLRSLAINRIAYTPIYKSGKLRAGTGFDPQEHIYLDSPEAALPPVCDRDAAIAARDYLCTLLEEFPLNTAVDRSVGLALLLSAAMRASGVRAPGFLLSKPSHGAGASTLADLAHIVLTGRRAPMINAAKNTAEIDKEIDAAQGHARAAVVVDNVPAGSLFNSIATAQVLQQDYRAARILGESRSPIVENTQLVMLTGVNVRVANDLVRRFVRCILDPNCERPEAKRFKRPTLLDDAIKERVQVLEACYTIIAAFERSGVASQAGVLAGYERWCATVAASLVWLGEADPLASQDAIHEDDPVTAQLSRLRDAWAALFGSRAVVTTSVALFNASRDTGLDEPGKPGVGERAAARHSLEELFDEIAVDARGKGTAQQLGRWLHKHQNRVTGEWKLVRPGSAHRNVASWQFIRHTPQVPPVPAARGSPPPPSAKSARPSDASAPITATPPQPTPPASVIAKWEEDEPTPAKTNGANGAAHAEPVDPRKALIKEMGVGPNGKPLGPNTAADLVGGFFSSAKEIANAAPDKLTALGPKYTAAAVESLQTWARRALGGAP